MNEEQVGAAAESEPAKRIIGGDPNKFVLGKCLKKVSTRVWKWHWSE